MHTILATVHMFYFSRRRQERETQQEKRNVQRNNINGTEEEKKKETNTRCLGSAKIKMLCRGAVFSFPWLFLPLENK